MRHPFDRRKRILKLVLVSVMISRFNPFLHYESRATAALRTVLAGAALALLMIACTTAQVGIPESERRFHGLNKTIMCPICPGESIDQSQATIALQMRDIVRDKLEEGWTDDQIRDFFVDRYGPSVLMEPPTEGIGILAWIVPPVIVGVAVAAFLLAINRMRKPGRRDWATPLRNDTDSSVDLESYYDRIEAALEPHLMGVSSHANEAGKGEKGMPDTPVTHGTRENLPDG